MKQSLVESTLGVNYSEALKAKSILWEPQAMPVVASSLVVSMADFLAAVKSKENKVAIDIQDYQNNTKLAAIVEYTPAEEEDVPGEWSLAFTFDKEDLTDVQVYTVHDTFFQDVAAVSSFKETGLQFKQTCFMITMFGVLADEIYKWLDVNAKEDELVELNFSKISE